MFCLQTDILLNIWPNKGHGLFSKLWFMVSHEQLFFLLILRSFGVLRGVKGRHVDLDTIRQN